MREAEDLMGALIGSQEILGSATCVSFFWTIASREPELAEPESRQASADLEACKRGKKTMIWALLWHQSDTNVAERRM